MTPKGEARRAMALTLGFDVLSAAIAMAAAVAMRWMATEGAPSNALTTGTVAAVVFAMAALFSFYSLRVHQQVWRHSGWPDVIRIMQAVGLTVLLFVPVVFIWNRLVGFPRSSLALALVIWVTLILVGRMVALTRSTRRPFQMFTPVREDAPIAVLVSNVSHAADVLRDLRSVKGGAPVRILGMLEIDGVETGRAIRGVPVMGGLGDLSKILDLLNVRYGRMPWVAVAGDVRARAKMSQVLEVAAKQGAEVMALGVGSEGLHLQPVRPADLLARPVRRLLTEPVEALLRGKRVFMTGAGGTIGSELSRQCAAMGVSHLTLFDASEYNLYAIDLTLREQYPDLDILAQLGDVRDPVRLEQIMEKAKPDIVIHAAALKHVPLMELNACEAILTNVGGAVNTFNVAEKLGVERMVFISTDKAVDPDNVMGATKRLAELALAYRAAGTDVAVSMVRFGNVLGSSGSVIPLFERQIAAGGPVTLTDERVSRYFMTVEEASSLVLQGAANNGSPGEASLYVLDMGEPILIRALADAMIRMKGMVPDQDIEVKTMGLRPGEKLHEALIYANERLLETGVSGLRKVTPETRRTKPDGFDERLLALLQAAATRRRKAALDLLSEMVPEYQPPDED